MKRILQFLSLVGLLMWFATDLQAQKGSRSSSSSYKPYNYRSSKSSYKSASTDKLPTYDVGGTKYKLGESYKTTGLPKVQRSTTAKKEFLNSRGYKEVPQGYEIDHVVPLSRGGTDKPYNMQLLPKEVHKQKTASERKKK
jgi:hypothetical protein